MLFIQNNSAVLYQQIVGGHPANLNLKGLVQIYTNKGHVERERKEEGVWGRDF